MRYRVRTTKAKPYKPVYWVEDTNRPQSIIGRSVRDSTTTSKRKAERLCARLNGGIGAAIKRREDRKARKRKANAGLRTKSYPSKHWEDSRTDAKMAACECCDALYRKGVGVDGMLNLLPLAKEHLHHMIPARLAKLHGNPHERINILSVDDSCHGHLKRVDNLILKGDWVGAVAESNRLHVPMDRFRAAAAHYGFDISRIGVLNA